MKFSPEVIAALQTLKNAAENDFELHRISVLEKDLTAPPTVEVIDDNHQKFDGVIFNMLKDGYFNTTISIHRYVYSYYYGDIPKGNVIHHVDKNTANNSATNLQSMTLSDHISLHENEDYQPTKKVCPVCGKTFFSSKGKKTCSEKCWRKSRGVISKCKHCGKDFLKYLPEQEFCSISCSTAEMDSNRNQILKICINCGKQFLAINEGALYCSRKCSNQYHYKNDRENRTCIICGKVFNAYKASKTQTCSPSCGAKLSHIKRK